MVCPLPCDLDDADGDWDVRIKLGDLGREDSKTSSACSKGSLFISLTGVADNESKVTLSVLISRLAIILVRIGVAAEGAPLMGAAAARLNGMLFMTRGVVNSRPRKRTAGEGQTRLLLGSTSLSEEEEEERAIKGRQFRSFRRFHSPWSSTAARRTLR